jgi:hypothetical protein
MHDNVVELLPCPFCGGLADTSAAEFGEGMRVNCLVCGAELEDKDTEIVERRWNTRPSPQPTGDVVERVAREIESFMLGRVGLPVCRNAAKAVLAALSAGSSEPTREMILEQAWRELDPNRTSVIRGVPDDFYGDDPRINVFDEKVDAGELPKLTIGLFLGEHKWAMQRFSPEQALGIAGMILSKPSVILAMEAARQKGGE